jgi:hypothetical protein
MANIKGKIRQSTRLKGRVAGTNEIVAQTVKISSGDILLGDLTNVDTAGQTDGAMMIFDGTSGNYEMKTQIENENLNIIGGTY